MEDMLSRTRLLVGDDAVDRLGKSRVAVFGLGGVGGYVVEALARSGVGALALIDNDIICPSNLNRQIYALHSTIGKYKADIAKSRVLDINPNISVTAHKCFYMPDTSGQFDFSDYDYIVDAIDTVTGKLELIKQAEISGTPVISSMGAGNKLEPAEFKVSDIYSTRVCPLARVMRRELNKLGIKKLKVVYSEEKPKASNAEAPQGSRRSTPGSIAFVPSAAGLIIAGEVIRDLSAGS